MAPSPTPKSRSTNAWLRMSPMPRAIGAVMLVIGGVWFFQGIGVAQGSQMSNNTSWAVLGGAIAIGGFVLLYRQNKITKAMIDEEQAEAARAAEAIEPDGP